MKTLLNAALLLTLASATARAQINAGALKPEPSLPFTMSQVATFKLPWRIAFLPDGRMLVTEKVGPDARRVPVAEICERLKSRRTAQCGCSRTTIPAGSSA